MEKKYSELIAFAKENGIEKIKLFDVKKDLVIDERVLLKCRVPICSSYGKNLMCPPNTFSPSEMRKIAACYDKALFMQFRQDIKSEFDGQKRMHEIVNLVEREAIKKDLYFATGFIAGTCKLCKECVGQNSKEACRHPFKARPSSESVGIDIIQTAKNLDMGFALNNLEFYTISSLILLD